MSSDSIMEFLLERVAACDRDHMLHILSVRIDGCPVFDMCRATPSDQLPSVAKELVAWISDRFPIEEPADVKLDWERKLARLIIREWTFSAHDFCYDCEEPEYENAEIKPRLIREVNRLYAAWEI